MKKGLSFAFLILLFIFTGSVLYSKLFAQQSPKGFTVTPSNVELQVKPGETVTKEITLTNSTDTDTEIKINRRNFTAQGEEGQVNLTTEESSYSLASWISVAPESVVVKKNSQGKFLATVKAPDNAEPGGHFGSVVFTTVPKKDLKQTGAVVSQEIASLFLVKIAGKVDEDARIESFSTPKWFFEFGPVPFDIRVKNNSTVHIKPAGSITINGTFGQKLTGSVESRNILPGAVRKIQGTLGNKLLIGRYTASVSIVYGTQNNAPLVAQTTFYAFPVRLGLLVLAALIIIIIMRKRLYKAIKIILIGK